MILRGSLLGGLSFPIVAFNLSGASNDREKREKKKRVIKVRKDLIEVECTYFFFESIAIDALVHIWPLYKGFWGQLLRHEGLPAILSPRLRHFFAK